MLAYIFDIQYLHRIVTYVVEQDNKKKMVDTESELTTMVTSDVLFKFNDINLYVHTIAEQLDTLFTESIINDEPNINSSNEIVRCIVNDSAIMPGPLSDDFSVDDDDVYTCKTNANCIIFTVQFTLQNFDSPRFNIKYNTTQREFQNNVATLSIKNISMSEFQFTLTFNGQLPLVWYVYGTKATNENYKPGFVQYVTETLEDLTTKVNELMQKT